MPKKILYSSEEKKVIPAKKSVSEPPSDGLSNPKISSSTAKKSLVEEPKRDPVPERASETGPLVGLQPEVAEFITTKHKENKYRADSFTFRSIIYPGLSSEKGIEFKMRRRNLVITLQWEPFKITIPESGTKYVNVAQTITNLPGYTVTFIIPIELNMKKRFGLVEINSRDKINIKFGLMEGGFQKDDNLFVPGSSVNWITNE